jgi:excisionase family DNA binding protein
MSTHPAPTATNRLLSLKEAAAYLQISERHVQTLRFKRLLPVTKLSSRCIRFRQSDLDRALEKLTEKELS